MSDPRPALTIDGKRCLIESLPPVFRMTDYRLIKVGDRLNCCTATLYHRHLTLKVIWTAPTPDQRLRTGALVAIRWNKSTTSEDGAVPIDRLIAVTQPDERINLFDTVNPAWPIPADLIVRGRTLIQALPRRFRQLFNAIFWDQQRFLRYLTGPAGLEGAHGGLNGNLCHALEVAEQALSQAEYQPFVFRALLILGSLLHDAGKADRYQLDPVHPRFRETEQGRRVGHRALVLDWLSEASTQLSSQLPVPQQRALLNLLATVSATPLWARLDAGEPPSLETRLVERADRWSMQKAAVQPAPSRVFTEQHAGEGQSCRT